MNDAVGLHGDQLEIRAVCSHQRTDAFQRGGDIVSIHGIFL
jgi:hypothetical protein